VIRLRKGDYDGAIADYDHSIAVGWLAYQSYIGRGNVKRARKDFDGAIEDYGAAIALNPKSPDAYISRANARRQKGDNEGAMVDYNTAVELGAPDPSAITPRSGAGAEATGGTPRPATVESHTEVRADPLPDAHIVENGATTEIRSESHQRNSAAMALADRASALMQQGDYDAAIEDCTKAIEIDPQLDIAYLNRGTARLHKGDEAGALADYNKGIEIRPNSPVLHLQRGSLLLKQGKRAEAQQDFDEAIKLLPSMKPMIDRLLNGAKRQ
jgi:tetratricopeptide (TPR) repeat protein